MGKPLHGIMMLAAGRGRHTCRYQCNSITGVMAEQILGVVESTPLEPFRLFANVLRCVNNLSIKEHRMRTLAIDHGGH